MTLAVYLGAVGRVVQIVGYGWKRVTCAAAYTHFSRHHALNEMEIALMRLKLRERHAGQGKLVVSRIGDDGIMTYGLGAL